jgi:hypothetical protein
LLKVVQCLRRAALAALLLVVLLRVLTLPTVVPLVHILLALLGLVGILSLLFLLLLAGLLVRILLGIVCHAILLTQCVLDAIAGYLTHSWLHE